MTARARPPVVSGGRVGVTELIVLGHPLAATGRGSARTVDPVVGASDEPILARLALWFADVAAEPPRAARQPRARPTEPAERKART